MNIFISLKLKSLKYTTMIMIAMWRKQKNVSSQKRNKKKTTFFCIQEQNLKIQINISCYMIICQSSTHLTMIRALVCITSWNIYFIVLQILQHIFCWKILSFLESNNSWTADFSDFYIAAMFFKINQKNVITKMFIGKIP